MSELERGFNPESQHPQQEEKSIVREALEISLNQAKEYQDSLEKYKKELFERNLALTQELESHVENNILTRDEANIILAYKLSEIEDHGLRDRTTDLYNEAGFNLQLASAIKHADRTGESLAIAYLDLRGFKALNDDPDIGHAGGDRALRYVGEFYGAEIREDDILARLHGDEFAIGFRNGEIEKIKAKYEGEEQQQKLTEFVKERFEHEKLPEGQRRVDPTKVNIGSRIGIVPYTKGESVAAMKEKADQVMNEKRLSEPNNGSR